MNVNHVDSSQINSNGAADEAAALTIISAAALGAIALPAMTGFAGIGIVGSGIAAGISALELAVFGGAVGAAAGAAVANGPEDRTDWSSVSFTKEQPASPASQPYEPVDESQAWADYIEDVRAGRF